MIDQVRSTIRTHALFAEGEPLWVAVSGGVDSMVLLHVLRRLGYPCSVAHVDHGLRGTESDGDRAFVRAYCEAHGIPFAVKQVDVHARMATSGESVQMAARALRMAWFKELAKNDARKVATAHHADDVSETFFLGLIQGMGARGWGSIPVRSDVLVRPLLDVTREAIIAYANAHGIRWREDASNASDAYLRNRIRHELLPLLETWRPGTTRNIQRNMRMFGELDTLARHAGVAAMQGLVAEADGTLRIPFERITASTPMLVLHHVLREQGLHPDRLEDILNAIQHRKTGARFPATTVEVFIDRTELVIAPHGPVGRSWRFHSLADVDTAGPLRLSVVDPTTIDRAVGPATVWFDAASVKFPLELRPWRVGDRMRPDGLGGSKLISDLLIDAKVPRDRKASCYVLADESHIIWLCGMRVAEGVKATATSAAVLRVEWIAA